MNDHPIATKDEWLEQRIALLAKEKEFTRLRDELTKVRKALPWVKVDKPYKFSDGAKDHSIADLFGEKSQLVIYHFMYGPEWEEPCKSCSFWADNFNGIDMHLANRDISFLAVSSAPIEKLDAIKDRMGWQFRWLSSGGSDFNTDFLVGFTDEQKQAGEMYYNYKTQPYFIDELPGISVFAKQADGSVYHTYSSYSRGIDILNGAYNIMDLTPKGRDEQEGIMQWLKFHDDYD